jgi:hypothetical protein
MQTDEREKRFLKSVACVVGDMMAHDGGLSSGEEQCEEDKRNHLCCAWICTASLAARAVVLSTI